MAEINEQDLKVSLERLDNVEKAFQMIFDMIKHIRDNLEKNGSIDIDFFNAEFEKLDIELIESI